MIEVFCIVSASFTHFENADLSRKRVIERHYINVVALVHLLTLEQQGILLTGGKVEFVIFPSKIAAFKIVPFDIYVHT